MIIAGCAGNIRLKHLNFCQADEVNGMTVIKVKCMIIKICRL